MNPEEYAVQGAEESVKPVSTQRQELVMDFSKFTFDGVEVRLTTSTTHKPQQENADSLKEDLNDMRQLEEFIKNPSHTVPVSPLLITVSGLPLSGKSTSLQKAFKVESTEETRFSHHEFVATGFKRKKPAKTLPVDTDTSFLFGLESGLEYNLKNMQLSNHSMEDLTFTDDTIKRYLTGVSKYLQLKQRNTQKSPSTKKRSITSVSSETSTHTSKLDEKVGQASEHIPPTENPHESSPKEFERMLIHGVGFVNIWDTSLNKTTRPFLESFGSFYTRSILWLFIDLERDLLKLHEPPKGAEKDSKSLQWRSRIEYLLRQCQMCKHSQYRKGEKSRVCTIFATYSSLTTPAPEESAEQLRVECEEAARQMGVDHLIDFDIVLVDKEKETAKPLRAKLRMCFEQVEPKQVPLSWILLRGSFIDHNSFCIKNSDLKQKAEDCGLPAEGEYSLDEFLKFCGSFGSIFDVRQLDQSSDYIIVKPFRFLISIDNFLRNVQHQNGIISAQNYTHEEHAIVEIMASVSLAVRLPDPGRYYFHSIRKGNRKTVIEPGTVQFVLSMSSPRINKDAEIIKLLLEALPNAEIDPYEWTNSVLIATQNKDGPRIGVFLSFQGDVIEISFQGVEDSQVDIEPLVETLVLSFKQMIAGKKHLTDIRYHFAIRCGQDEYKDTVPFNPYHKRHVLPNETLCEKCLAETKDERIRKSWNKVLQKHPIATSNKLNGDLSPYDVAKVVEEVSKYPIQAVQLLAKELGVEKYFTGQKLKKGESYMWLLFGMINEWQSHLDKDDESPKKVLARHLVTVDGKWSEFKAQNAVVEPVTDCQEPNFTRLARKIDMQVLTPQILRRLSSVDKGKQHCT